jgi:hypothetical protein
VHAIVQNIYEDGLKTVTVYRWCYSQNVNAPAMTPLAMFTGKMRYARRVIGNDSAKNNGGGITSRSLYKGKVRQGMEKSQRRNELVHRQIVVDPMRQEMQRQENRSIRQQAIDMEQEPMEAVFQQGPDHVSQEETG